MNCFHHRKAPSISQSPDKSGSPSYDTMYCPYDFRPCFSASQCDNEEQSTAVCWIVILLQGLLALFLITFSSVRRYRRSAKRQKKEGKVVLPMMKRTMSNVITKVPENGENPWLDGIEDDSDESSMSMSDIGMSEVTGNIISKNAKAFASKEKKKRKIKNFLSDKKKKPKSRRTAFFAKNEFILETPLCKTFRSEENFILSNADPDVIRPSSHGPEYVLIPEWTGGTVLRTALNALTRSDANGPNQDMLTSNLGWSFFASFFASFLALVFQYERAMKECIDNEEIEDHMIIGTSKWIRENGQAFKGTIDAFKFLPIFLLVAYVGFLVDRWRKFMVECHTIQGRIKDFGLLLGAIPSVPVSIEDRKHLYKIYRYLNSIHILLYRNFISLFKNGDDGIARMVDIGLITEDEAIIIDSWGNKAREGLLSMLMVEIKQMLSRSEDKIDATANSIVIKEKACSLRGHMSRFHDLFLRDNPNEYLFVMMLLIYLLNGLVIFGFPIMMYADTDSTYVGCFQPMAFIGTFIFLIAFDIPFVLTRSLQNPFDEKGDIDVDNLVASIEWAIFETMRAAFFETHEENPGTPSAGRGSCLLSASKRNILIEKSERRDPTLDLRKGGYGDL